MGTQERPYVLLIRLLSRRAYRKRNHAVPLETQNYILRPTRKRLSIQIQALAPNLFNFKAMLCARKCVRKVQHRLSEKLTILVPSLSTTAAVVERTLPRPADNYLSRLVPQTPYRPYSGNRSYGNDGWWPARPDAGSAEPCTVHRAASVHQPKI